MSSAAAPVHPHCCWPRLVRCGADPAGCRRLRAIYTARPPHARADSSQRRRLQLMLQAGSLASSHPGGSSGGSKRLDAAGSTSSAALAADVGSGNGSVAAPAPPRFTQVAERFLKDASWDVQDLVDDAMAALRRKPAYAPLEVTSWRMLMPAANSPEFSLGFMGFTLSPPRSSAPTGWMWKFRAPCKGFVRTLIRRLCRQVGRVFLQERLPAAWVRQVDVGEGVQLEGYACLRCNLPCLLHLL